MSEGHVTTDHNKIRQWAEERGGHPATVKATKSNGEPGVLRLDFEPRDAGLESIGWADFFDRSCTRTALKAGKSAASTNLSIGRHRTSELGAKPSHSRDLIRDAVCSDSHTAESAVDRGLRSKVARWFSAGHVGAPEKGDVSSSKPFRGFAQNLSADKPRRLLLAVLMLSRSGMRSASLSR